MEIYTFLLFLSPKSIRLNSTHYVHMKISNQREPWHIIFNNSSDIDFKGFMNLYKKCTAKKYFLLVIDTILTLDEYLGIIKDLLERI